MKRDGKVFTGVARAVLCLALAGMLLANVFPAVSAFASAAGQNDGLDEEERELMQNIEPKMMVESYEIVEGERSKGEPFVLEIHARNTNQYADAFNVLMTFVSETDNVRLRDKTSNQHYEPVVRAGEQISYRVELEVMDLYEMDTMVINIIFSYVDRQSYGYTNTSMITPRIMESCVMEIDSLSVAQKAVTGAKALVNVRYSNAGSRRVENIRMIIRGDILEDGQEIRLEELREGEQKYRDCYVSFREPGSQTLQISFLYTDEDGKEYTLEPKEFQVQVTPSGESGVQVTRTGGRFSDIEKGKIYLLCAGLGAVAAAVSVVGIVMVRRKEGDGEKNDESGQNNRN